MRKAFIPIVTGLLFTVLYALFPSKMHFVDGVGYAWDIENMPIMYQWHPHHPIWLPMMDVLYHLAKTILPSIRSMGFLTFLNAIFGGISIVLMITLIQKLTSKYWLGVITGIFIGTSWGFMHYCCDVNIYMIELVILLWIMHILVSGDSLSIRSSVYATLLILLASLIHQMVFFFTIVVLAAIILRTDPGKKLKTAGGCILLYAVLILGINVFIYSIAKPLVEAEMNTTFMGWLTAYGSNPAWWSILIDGFSRAQGIFHFSQINLFFHTPDADLIYYESHFNKPDAMSPWYTIFHFFIVATILWEIVDLFRSRNPNLHNVRTVLLIWFLLYFIFNQFYCAFEIHYKLFYLIPLISLWLLRIAEFRGKAFTAINYFVLLLALFIGTWNFITAMYPNSKPETNPSLAYVLDLKPVVKEGDLVIFSRQQYYVAWLFKYYTDADAVPFRYQFSRFAQEEEGFLEVDRQTIEYFEGKYNRILLSDHAAETRPRQWYFSGYFFPPPHPDLMAIHPSSIQRKEIIEAENERILQRVELVPAMRYVGTPNPMDEIIDSDE